MDAIEAPLLDAAKSPEYERERRLERQDIVEKQAEDKEQSDNDDDEFARDLRKGIKTSEVLGMIAKNRAGSLEKGLLKDIMKTVIDLQLRIPGKFFSLIRSNENQDDLIDYLQNQLFEIKNNEFSLNDKRKRARKLFWNLNFGVIFGIIYKCATCFGSQKLLAIIREMCAEHDKPVNFLIEKYIVMWYTKIVPIDEIRERIKDKDFSQTAKEVMRYFVVHYCRYHKTLPQEKQRIESVLGINAKELLKNEQKEFHFS